MSMDWKTAREQMESAPGSFRAVRRNWHTKPGKPMVIPFILGARWAGSPEEGFQDLAYILVSREPGMNAEFRRYVPTQADAEADDWEIR